MCCLRPFYQLFLVGYSCPSKVIIVQYGRFTCGVFTVVILDEIYFTLLRFNVDGQQIIPHFITVVRQSSDGHQMVIRQSSGSHQAVIRQSSDFYQIFISFETQQQCQNTERINMNQLEAWLDGSSFKEALPHIWTLQSNLYIIQHLYYLKIP